MCRIFFVDGQTAVANKGMFVYILMNADMQRAQHGPHLIRRGLKRICSFEDAVLVDRLPALLFCCWKSDELI